MNNNVSIQVIFHGQPIAGIVAETREQARAASYLVKIEYQDLKPILTIEVGNVFLFFILLMLKPPKKEDDKRILHLQNFSSSLSKQYHLKNSKTIRQIM